MKKSELNTSELRKKINAFRVAQRWHNKNKQGGNFGINIYFAKEHNRDIDKEITGYYNKEGEIINLNFSSLYGGGGFQLQREDFLTLDILASKIKSCLEWEKKENEALKKVFPQEVAL